MSEKRFQDSIALAALLHDIGKFKQRTGLEEDGGKTHVQIGHEWLVSQYGEGIVAAGARNHHGNEPETWETNLGLIFYEADNCAASERKTSFDPQVDLEKKWHREIQLANVFSRVRDPAPEGKLGAAPATFNPLSPLGQWNEPARKEGRNREEGYNRLWKDFEAEFESLRASNNHYNVDAILHLLEKYTSFIPSITLKIYGDSDEATYKKHPDVSLFDHLKIASATAACLTNYHKHCHEGRWENEILKQEIAGESTWERNDQIFQLVGGDLSGVQKFIYTISSKGALKALKGRSFFLELLTEHSVDRLIEEMGLSRCNVIFTGGGHFYLLAPNIPAIQEAMNRVRKEVNDYLFEAFSGSIQLFIEAVSFGKRDFKDSSKVWGSLSREIEKTKRLKWEDKVDQLLSEPMMPHDSCLTENCKVCGREDKPLRQLSGDKQDVMVCDYCRDQYWLGNLIQDSVRRGIHPLIYRWDDRPPVERYVQIGGSYYQFAAGALGKAKEEIVAKASAVFHLNDWDLRNFRHPRSRPLLAGLYLPDEDNCRELEGMGECGFGMGLLAVLRIDVDHLGRIFSSAVPEGERTLSLMASLSRQLSLFFKYHINQLMENRAGYPEANQVVDRPGEKRLSIVYSGGDDLFLIGHWLDVTETAYHVRNAFSRFTANPYITISAGVALGDAHDPVYRLAEKAGHAEELAKENGRQSITLFDAHTVKWEDADRILALTGDVRDLFRVKDDRLALSDGSISSAVLYRLLTLAREHKREEGWILPKLAYMFGRSEPKNKEVAEAWGILKNYAFQTM